jgi:hypothetical protein
MKPRHAALSFSISLICETLPDARNTSNLEPPGRHRRAAYGGLCRFTPQFGGAPTEPIELVLAHIEQALDEDDASTQKAAFLVTALVHAPDMLEPVRRYYRVLLEPLRSEGGDMHEVRHALLAVEGIFLLRGLGFVEVSADEQKSVLLHARDIVVAVLAKHRACAPPRS